jgi:hypothetical protein
VKPKLFLIPDDSKLVGEFYRKLRNELEKSKSIIIKTVLPYEGNGYNVFWATSVFLELGSGGVSLGVGYCFEFYCEEKVNEMVFYSEDFTNYIEIPSHYFTRHTEGAPLLTSTDDLLYQCDKINEFSFTFEEINIVANIEVGGILMRGIGSDLKLKSFLRLSFDEQNDLEFIIKLCDGIHKVLRFLCYKKNIVIEKMELVNSNPKRSNIGQLFVNYSSDDHQLAYYPKHSPYPYLKDQLHTFFNAVLSDNHLYSKHLPGNNEYFMGYDVIRLLNIFSAFENEYNKLPKTIRSKDVSHLLHIRDTVINKINESYNEAVLPTDREFVDSAIQRVQQIGTTYGEVQKIVNAYNFCADDLVQSLEFWGIDKGSANMVAKRLCDLRDRIVHNNYDESINEHQISVDISFLEKLTYTMMLRRFGIQNIGQIINELFL